MAMILLFAQIGTGGAKLQGGAEVETPDSAGSVLTAIDVAPTSMTATVGQTYSVTATGIFTPLSAAREMLMEDRSASPAQDVTNQCVWTSSNTSVATLGPKANPQTVHAVGIGSATITCTIGSVFGINQLTVAGLVIAPVSIPATVVNTPYTVTFSATGGTAPYTFSVSTGLSQLTAAGFHLSGNTLSGTATTAASIAFDITATDSATPTPNTGVRQYQLTIQPPAGTNTRQAALPQVWGKPHEADFPVPCNAANNCYRKFIHTNGSGDYACTAAGLQSSYTAWLSAPANQWWEVIVDDGLSTATGGQCKISATTGVVLNLNAKLGATGFWWLHSAHPTTPGQTVCNHMIDPNPAINQRAPTLTCLDAPNNLFQVSSTSSANGYLINMASPDSAGYGPSHIRITNGEWYIRGSNSVDPLSFIPNVVAGDPRSMCSHVGFDYNWVHSDRGDDAKSSINTTVTNSLSFGCGLGWVNRNYFCCMARPGAEGHVISLTDSQPGTMVVGNWFEGQAVQLFAGGRIPSLGTNFNPTDIELRKNYFTQNPLWISGSTGAAICKSVGPGGGFANKNAFELKLGVRFLIDANIFEWSSVCGQGGQLVTVNVRSCSGGVQCDGYGSAVTDITFTNNIQRHAGNMTQTAGRSSGVDAGLNPSFPGRRWNFINNLGYDIANNASHTGSGPFYFFSLGGAAGGSIRFRCNATRDALGVVTLDCTDNTYRTITSMSIASAPTRSTCTATSSTTATVACGGTAVPRPCTLNNCQIVTINFSPVTAYSPYVNGDRVNISNTPMTAATRIMCGTATNCGGSTGGSVQYRCGSTATQNNNDNEPGCPQVDVSTIHSGDLALIGMKQTVQSVGDPTIVISCADKTYNTPGSETSGPLGIISPPSLPGTIGLVTPGLIVKYQSIAGSPGTTTGCVFHNLQGWYADSIISHNTNVGRDTGAGFRNPNVRGGGGTQVFPYTINNQFQDNMDILDPAGMSGGQGWRAGSQSEGQNSQRAGFDLATATLDHITFAGRSSQASNYRRYNPTCFAAGNCPAGNAAGTVASPATYWFPSVGPCPGSTVTTSGSGFVSGTSCDGPGFNGMMNNVPFLLDTAGDPLNDYALQPYTVVGSGAGNTCTANCGSPYARGGSRQASDGTDMGANMNKIRHALQRTIYDDCSAATGTCGTGPNPE